MGQPEYITWDYFWKVINDLKNQIANLVGGGVTSVTGNIVDNTNPSAPVITQQQSDWNESDNTKPDFIKNKPTIPSADSTPITIAALQSGIAAQTLADGNYILTDGNNPGLVVTVVNGQLSPQGNINQTFVSQAHFQVGTQIGSTSGTLNVKDGTQILNSTPVSWADTDPVNTIASNIAAAIDFPGYTAYTIGANVYINSPTATNGGVISIANVSGNNLIVSNVTNFTGGRVNPLLVDYDLVNDAITAAYDNFQNAVKWYAGNEAAAPFPFGGSIASGNTMLQDGGSYIYQSDLQGFINNTTLGRGSIQVTGSNADIEENIVSGTGFLTVQGDGIGTVYNNTIEQGASFNVQNCAGNISNNIINNSAQVDLSLYTANRDFTNNVIGWNYAQHGNSMIQPTGVALNGLTINDNTSDYPNDQIIASNTLDCALTADVVGTGIWTILNTVTINTVTNLNKASKYFTIKPQLGEVITFDRLSATNIKGIAVGVPIVLVGTNKDFVNCIQDGTNLYILDFHNF